MIIQDIPGINPKISRVQGMLIAANIGELFLNQNEEWIKKDLLRQSATAKGPANLLGLNVHHLLHLTYVTNVESLPPLWTSLERAPKENHLEMLQAALDGAEALLYAQFTIVVNLELLKRFLGIQILMEDREYLTMGVQPFTLGQHTIAVQKALAACSARHALVVRGGAALSLADT